MIKDEIMKLVRKEISDSMNKISHEGLNVNLDHIKSSMKRNLTVSGLLGIGLLFLLLGIVKYIPNLVGVSEGAAFIIIGVLIILVGLIYRAGATA